MTPQNLHPKVTHIVVMLPLTQTDNYSHQFKPTSVFTGNFLCNTNATKIQSSFNSCFSSFNRVHSMGSVNCKVNKYDNVMLNVMLSKQKYLQR